MGGGSRNGQSREAPARESGIVAAERRRATKTLLEAQPTSATIEAAAADGSEGLLTAGIAAAVLVAGLVAGFGLRRLLRIG